MNNKKNAPLSFVKRALKEASVCEMAFWWITRILIIFCAVKNSEHLAFYLIVLITTFSADILHILVPSFNLSARVQTYISALSMLSTVVGLGFGIIEKHPDYDLILQLSGGIFSGALGYYIINALRKPVKKNDFTFNTFFTLCFSGSVTIYRKLTEFFCDFYFGTNLCHVEFIGDNHWFYNIFGMAMSPEAQRPLFDTDEDFIMSIIGGVISTVAAYVSYVIRNRKIFGFSKPDLSGVFHNVGAKIRNKLNLEMEKLRRDTSIFDLLFWWCVRISMLYAFIVWDNRPEAILLSANLVATFTITLIHLIFPSTSVLSKISYKVQSLITVIVFLGSYCGNYCFVYNIVPRFDLFLHFISGALCVMGGYYISLILIKPSGRKDSFIVALFSFLFSSFIMPAWEISEFIGDFIWGTSNQGFYWGPTDESFFFKVFGHGKGNTMLYYLFDTVYDVLLAIVTTVITFVLLYIFLEYKRRKESSVAAAEEKEAVTC